MARLGHHQERADQVDLDHLGEGGEVVRLDGVGLLDAARDALGDADAGAVDEDALLPVRLARGRERRIDARLAGDVALGEDAADLLGELLAGVRIEVEEGNLDALGRKRPGRGGAEARCATGDDGGDGLVELHRRYSLSHERLPCSHGHSAASTASAGRERQGPKPIKCG